MSKSIRLKCPHCPFRPRTRQDALYHALKFHNPANPMTPFPKQPIRRMPRALIPFVVSLLFVFFGGCSDMKRLTGADHESLSEARVQRVACCKDGASYPASVPQGHQDFCSDIGAEGLNTGEVTYYAIRGASRFCAGRAIVGSEFYQ